MKDKRILYVSSEVIPYLPETETASTSFEVARKMHSIGAQIRIFMPRFGVINERRHQLHEVIRLSGMNLIINDMDMPLIIKVASIPKERMQVYFIDNDEYFKRKALYTDVIHVHGWMASLVPLYLREYYKNDPLFSDSKIVTSVYNSDIEGSIGENLVEKIKFDTIPEEKLKSLTNADHSDLIKIALENSDAVIKGSENIPEEIEKFILDNQIPVLDFESAEDYSNFYLTEVL